MVNKTCQTNTETHTPSDTHKHTTTHTKADVLGPLLRDHDRLVLLQVEAQEALLVTEVFHLRPPVDCLREVALHPAAVTPRRLGGTPGTADPHTSHVYGTLQYMQYIQSTGDNGALEGQVFLNSASKEITA